MFESQQYPFYPTFHYFKFKWLSFPAVMSAACACVNPSTIFGDPKYAESYASRGSSQSVQKPALKDRISHRALLDISESHLSLPTDFAVNP